MAEGIAARRSIGNRVTDVVQQITVNSMTFGLYIFFLLDFFLRLSARIPGYGALRPTALLVLLIAGSLFLQREKLKGKASDPIMKAILVLLAYIALTLPLVEWPGSVIRSNLSEFIKAVVFLFFTALIIDTDKRLRLFVGVFVACQVARVLEPLYLNITSGYWGTSNAFMDEERLAGAPADVINPNELGFVIVTAIPFLHYLLFQGNKKAKILYCILLPPLLYALVLTLSRGAFIVLLVVAWMIFKESRHKFFLALAGLLIVIFAWGNMSSTQQARYLSLVSDDGAGSSSVEGRLDGMIQEFGLGMERPIVGHGLGTTPEAKFHSFGSTQASHNLYAELIIELGIIGAFLFLHFLWKIYRQFKKNRMQLATLNLTGRDYYTRLNKALVAVFWMYVVYSINYWGLSIYYWYLFGGVAIAVDRLIQQKIAVSDHFERRTPTKRESSARLRRPVAVRPGLPGRQI